jgi:hypothetical protein
MYVKNSELRSAQKIFNRLKKKDAVMWSSMINGLAILPCIHGHGNETFE